ncbi:elongation factor P-like protein EfpL [Endothiovibrio diazotrophicus]
MRASELKKGAVVTIDGEAYVVKGVQVQTSSSRSGNTLYKVEFRHAVTKRKFDKAFKGEDVLAEADFQRRAVQFLFRETDSCTFMDNESYEQYALDNEAIEAELPYLIDGLEGINVLLVEGAPAGVELPGSVEMEVVETTPSIKGATAAARSKPATLTTGLVVQVPEYIAQGERIKVNTTSGEFMSRA